MKNISKLLVVALVTSVFLTATTLVSALGSGSISGTVFLDTTCNGLDLSDKPLTKVEATLTSNVKKSKLTLKTKSDAQGNFRFTNLPYGTYTLQVKPDGAYRPKEEIGLYQISEVNGAVSDTFVFCKKKAN